MRPLVHQAAAVAALLGSGLVAPAAHAAEYASVVSATPVTASVPVARQACSDEQRLVQQRPSGAGALIGAIAGGVIGNSVGGGFGRAAATGLGVVAGSVIGDQVEANTSPVTELPVRRCRTVSSYENRIVGYDVVYDYAGQRYSTRTARDPGTQLAVSVQPADAIGTNLPAPAYADPVLESAPPQRIYYQPVPRSVYYYDDAPAAVYLAPAIGFSIGYSGGYYGGSRGRHWR